MIYELRVYKCVPGRLPALLNRFATITLKLWDKHGIKQAGLAGVLADIHAAHRDRDNFGA